MATTGLGPSSCGTGTTSSQPALEEAMIGVGEINDVYRVGCGVWSNGFTSRYSKHAIHASTTGRWRELQLRDKDWELEGGNIVSGSQIKRVSKQFLWWKFTFKKTAK